MWHAWGTGEVFTGFWLGDPGRRWEGNIKMDLREIGIYGMNLIRLDFCEHGNEPSGSIKKAGCCLTS
jgi:hypothetical protein